MASIETDSPSTPEEPMERLGAGMARRAQADDEQCVLLPCEKSPMKWLLSAVRSHATLSSGLVRLKGRGDLIPDCGPRHSAKPLKRRKQ
jgi:hypothetical protein